MEADPVSLGRREHWESIYGTEAVRLSWYQSEPDVSFQLIESLRLGTDTPIIDIGGGASTHRRCPSCPQLLRG